MCGGLNCCKPKAKDDTDAETLYQEKVYYEDYATKKKSSRRLPIPIISRDGRKDIDSGSINSFSNVQSKNNNYDLTITKTIKTPTAPSKKALLMKANKGKIAPAPAPAPAYHQTTYLRLVKETTSTTSTNLNPISKRGSDSGLEKLQRRRSQDFSTHRLYISNLGPNMTIEELKEVFPGNVNILIKRSRRRGVTSVVEFQSPADCEKAYLRVKGMVLNGQPLVIAPKLRHEVLLD